MAKKPIQASLNPALYTAIQEISTRSNRSNSNTIEQLAEMGAKVLSDSKYAGTFSSESQKYLKSINLEEAIFRLRELNDRGV
tara:strand:+ start:310 stop:555 length:246 start_codon:yes stop_codon:yes gene_type:complete